jgi:glycosyltransferase involved in cell wall biosynthesis
MAAARPIVATRVGGVADLTGEAESGSSGHEISDGDFKAVSVGVLTRPEDPGGFSRAIAYLLEDKERSAGLGQAGRARVRDRYSVGRLVEDLTDLYVKGHEESGNKA